MHEHYLRSTELLIWRHLQVIQIYQAEVLGNRHYATTQASA